MFAIISADGRQYRVAKGDIIRFDRMKTEPGDSFETSQVLAIPEEDNKLKIGSPVVEGAKVEGTVLQHGRTKKLLFLKGSVENLPQEVWSSSRSHSSNNK